MPQPAVPAARRSYGSIFLKIVSWGGGFFIGVSTGIFMVDPDFHQKLEDIAERKAAEMALEANMMAGEGIFNPELLMSHYFVDEDVQPETTETATMRLQAGSQAFAVPGGHVHLTELASNLPSHTTSMVSSAATADDEPPYQLTSFGVFDGQGSSVTSRYVGKLLVPGLVEQSLQLGYFTKAQARNNAEIHHMMKGLFTYIDYLLLESSQRLIQSKLPTAEVMSQSSPALFGSCALAALHDPQRNVLRVANAGDSRAVLGRWDPQAKRYIAIPLSAEHNGNNPCEVSRLQKEHPDENVIDPETGSLLGLRVTRALGFGIFKWPSSVARIASENFWGPRPKSDHALKAPPYLISEPEVVETDVHSTGDHPDFLIMANRRLWELFDNQDAVACVEAWLNEFHPSEATADGPQTTLNSKLRYLVTQGFTGLKRKMQLDSDQPFSPGGRQSRRITDNDDTSIDRQSGQLTWKAQNKHFVVEDDHCGVHLIKNALGGSRRGLFESVMTLRPPISPSVRGDLSVVVTFFDDQQRDNTLDTAQGAVPMIYIGSQEPSDGR